MRRALTFENVAVAILATMALFIVWLSMAHEFGVASPCRDKAALVEIRCEHPSHELERDGLLWACRCEP